MTRRALVSLWGVRRSDTAQAQILRDLWCDRRQIKDLMANRLVVVHDHITMAQ
jgi:hypothetical protein